MKKTLLLLSLILLTNQLFSQETIKFKKGFIGISLGTSIYVGSEYRVVNDVVNTPSYGNSTDSFRPALAIRPGTFGLNLNLIDAGYDIWKGIGLNLRWQGGAYVISKYNENLIVNYGGIMVGPMYSIYLNEELTIDLKSRFGRSYFGSSHEVDYGYGNGKFKNEFNYYNLSVDAGISLRYNFAKKWTIISNLEYQYFYSGMKESLDRINVSTGIGFRF
ncbi:hypothetical protein MM236_14275 [Belliella sp. DSM 107340]|uniref:Outer membrane protein beta-barrel domain-containing protein n=1 Tax=Belliella calami TaxID=2923436 RepID=A0ABS9URD3_9BACT|nr:hypothetical protein [Belliella calami]MCH7399167.1 hypothetical protein [Belliella calami]